MCYSTFSISHRWSEHKILPTAHLNFRLLVKVVHVHYFLRLTLNFIYAFVNSEMSGGVYGGGKFWILHFFQCKLFCTFFIATQKFVAKIGKRQAILSLFFADEVGALVFDPGHYSFRVGFAGEEFPKVSFYNLFFYLLFHYRWCCEKFVNYF